MLTKICTSCGKELPASTEYFHKNPKGKFGLQQKCKSCRAWSNPDNTEKEAQRKYSKKYYAKNKNNIIKKLTEWKANNPEKVKHHKLNDYSRHKRAYVLRALKRLRLLQGLETDWSEQNIENLFEKQQGLCYYCGCDISNGYDIEHKIPISRGGSNLIENICLSCENCNSRKHTKTEEEFLCKFV